MRTVLSFFLIFSVTQIATAQISTTAYRALGQPDLVHNGLNEVQGTELYSPSSIALDARGGVTHIYIGDPGNLRVLGWADTASYQIGDPPAVVLGQSSPQNTNGIGNQGFTISSQGVTSGPYGMAVDPGTGNLYVADAGNNRILRFPSPFSNPSNYTPDAVIGQASFSTNGASVSPTGLNAPQAVAFDTAGNLWVADTGNHRVVRFPAAVLAALPQTPLPGADTVLGQKDFNSNPVNAGGAVSANGFNTPRGIAFDTQNNLYVSDSGNLRVLRWSAPVSGGQGAELAIGQSGLNARVVTSPPTSTSMAGLTSGGATGPTGISVTSTGTLYVAIPGDNRVLVMPFGSPASTVYGQATFTTATPNSSTQPFASQNGLAAPFDVKVDANGNVYIADLGNNRALMYTGGLRSASKVWGQLNFSSNEPNRIKATSIDYPFGIALDYSQQPYALYVSDEKNNRILIWKDSAHFVSGDPADLVIGQPDLVTGIANSGNSAQTPVATSLAAPRGIALDSAGNLYVADAGNNRVLHYPRPVAQQGQITPDIVLGQPNFTSSSAGVSASALSTPSGVTVGPAGEVFIADTSNSRVVQFLPNPTTGATAIQVYGQPNLSSNATPSVASPQSLTTPIGVFLDQNYNLYVADTGANRLLVFLNVQGIHGNGQPANIVFGQSSFSGSAAGGGATGLRTPFQAMTDGNGNIIVSDSGNGRILVFPSLLNSQVQGTSAIYQIGTGNVSNAATASSLFGPIGILVDRKNTLYVGDTGNNRVVQFLGASVVANAAGFQLLASAPMAPGSLATLKATPLCLTYGLQCVLPSQKNNAGSTPLPTSLSGWQVVVNDTLVAPLTFAGPDSTGIGQVNFQVPAVPTAPPNGSNRIALRTPDTNELLAGGTFNVNSVGPGLFTQNAQGTGQAWIVNQDNSINGPGHAAPRGSIVSLYGTGQGQVIPAVPDGQPPSGLSQTITVPGSDAQSCAQQNAICALFGTGTPVYGTVQFSGLAPLYPGEWQINVQIPSNAPTGTAVPVHVVIGGSPSNSVTMAIQ